jgi:hypothetical protein
MASKFPLDTLPLSIDDELARCRHLQSELHELVDHSRTTIERSHELVEVSRRFQFPAMFDGLLGRTMGR